MKAERKSCLIKLAILLLFIILFLNVAQEKHLIPVDQHPAIIPLWNTGFYDNYREVLYGDSSERPSLKITVLPSFNSVYTLAFRHNKVKIRKAGRLTENGKVKIKTNEISLSKEVYDNLSELFYYALLQTKVDTTFNQGLDGTTYYLSSFIRLNSV